MKIEPLEARERELLAEIARLKAQLEHQGHVDLRAARTTPVGRDELFSAVEKTRMPMILTDPNQPDDPIVFANRAFQDLSGYGSDELVGRNCRFLQGAETDPAQIQRIREALATNSDIAIEIVNYRHDGSTFLNELYISPVFDHDGALLCRFGSQLDITGFGKARRDLEASERRQRAILDSSVDFAIVVTDRDGRVTDWNTGAERTMGWSAQEMIGQTVERIFTPEDRAAGRGQAEMREALVRGRASDERWHLKANGSRFFASGEMMPLRERDGTHTGYIKIIRDRTAEHEAGQALRRTEESLRRAQEVGGVGFFSLAVPDGDLRPSPEFCRLYGVPVRDSYPPSVFEALVLPEDAALVSSREGRARGEIVRDVEYRIRRADTGEMRWIARTGEIERDGAGRPVSFSGVVRDVTEQRAAQFALQTSEAYWRGLFEKLDGGFILGEVIRGDGGRVVDWRYLAVNPAWGRMVGIDETTVVGRTVRELIPGIEDAWVDEMAVVVETGTPGAFLRQVGPLRQWYEGHIYRTEGDRFAVIFTNVTERRDEERRRSALLDLSDRLRDEAHPAAMAMIGSEVLGRTLDADRVGYGTIGADGESFVVEEDWTVPGFPSLAGRYRLDDYGRYAVDLRQGRTVAIPDVREDPRTADTAAILEAVRARALINLPVAENSRTVAILYINCGEPRIWTDGDIGFARDVAERLRQATERRRAEQELRALTASLERQVEERTRERDRFWRLSRDPLLVADAEGRWVAISPAWTDILGWSEAELLGRTSEWMEHPEDRTKTRNEVDSIAQGEVTLRFENRFRAKAGDYHWFSWTAVPSEDGLMYCVARDVTEQKAQVEAQAKLEEQLRQSQKMEAVGQLTGGLAHDFNNLLAGISGSLELMNTRISQGRLRDIEKYMVAAQGAAQRAAALTHRLLAFSRRQTLAPKPTDVNRLVAGMMDLIRRTVGPSIEIEHVGAAGLWPALVDPSQLENALLNLCINARDAMPGGGRITIETANRWLDRFAAKQRELPEGQYLSLCVSDTGTGMPPEVIAKAFDPFFTTKPLGEGTGLGLSMIYGFANQSGGQVRIYSEVGQGTMVCIYLPRHLGEAETADGIGLHATEVARAADDETVLVVDDEPTVRLLVTDVLEDFGYTAIEAADGAAGLKILQSDVRIDLLVTDVGLPGGMNGRQMVDAARRSRPALKVLFITGFAENALLHNGQLEPGMAVLTKPFSIDALGARIREMIAG